MGCNICNVGTIGSKWTRELKLGSKSLRAAALEFNMTIEEVMEHVKHHEMEDKEENKLVSLLDDPDFFYNELLLLFRNLKEWLTFTMESERLDKANMELGMKLIREIRETLKFVAELQGKLNKGDTYYQQYIQIQGDLNVLLSAVLNDMCPECQDRVMMNPKVVKMLEEENANKKK